MVDFFCFFWGEKNGEEEYGFGLPLRKGKYGGRGEWKRGVFTARESVVYSGSVSCRVAFLGGGGKRVGEGVGERFGRM